jgi:N-acylglucosamine 2-epimerase
MLEEPRLQNLLEVYETELFEHVMPFWLEHAVDDEYGGLLTCLSDDSSVISTDKYMWSQLRALWVFSALYHKLEPREQWLEVAWGIFRFVEKFGRDASGYWIFSTSRTGKPLKPAISIYTDGFAIYGLTEFARATGDERAIRLALETFEQAQARLARPGSYPSDPYPIPEGVKAHGISMIFSLAFHELASLLKDERIREASKIQAEQVMGAFLRPDHNLLYEFANLNNTLIDSPRGRAVVPGHAIESLWFMIHIYLHVGDAKKIQQAIEAIKWHVEFGWDGEYGGLVLARDAEGGEPWWPFADSKLWWPHTEALYALLLAYEHSGEAWCLEWFDRVHNYSFNYFPVREHGEWTQKLTREGKPFRETVALPVKDPFHLPRALLYCILGLRRLAKPGSEASMRQSTINGR